MPNLLLLLFLSLPGAILSTTCPGNDLTDAERTLLTRVHNSIRREIAQGVANNYHGGKLPAGKNIYRMRYSCELEQAAIDASQTFCSASLEEPQKYGQNIQAYVTPSIIARPKNDLLEDAVKQWYLPVIYYGQRDAANKFTDPRLYTFANLAYDKNTALGCHYAKCQGPDRIVISCMYNNVVPDNAVIYEPGTACVKDADCTTYPQSTCKDSLCIIPTPHPPNPPNPPPAMSPNAEMTDAARKKVLGMHNWRRSQVALGNVQNGKNAYNCPTATDMYKIEYDCDLENSALAYAKQCSLVGSAEGTRPGEGENVHKGALVTDPEAAVQTAVQAWWSQISQNGLNAQMKFTAFLKDKPDAPTAFTQMAWAKSVKLGCAVSNCQADTFTVCRYKAAGNIVGEFIYTKGNVCDACKATCITAEGLCPTP
uniref:Secreted protein 5 n=1 Tax=Ancylostoma caninum TaxID=29170 RepID=Q86GK5_ANCCA|nr:secreted protein 5 precursor [Ancylostoma caninum]